ncbi:MAG: hypothetical protein RR846_00935 [Oscillospiraceae bacterium]
MKSYRVMAKGQGERSRRKARLKGKAQGARRKSQGAGKKAQAIKHKGNIA